MLEGKQKDGQGDPEDAPAEPEKEVTVVQRALPQALFEPNPLEGCLWEPPVTWKGSRWACSRAGAMSSQTCPGQLQATTLLFKGFIKE